MLTSGVQRPDRVLHGDHVEERERRHRLRSLDNFLEVEVDLRVRFGGSALILEKMRGEETHSRVGVREQDRENIELSDGNQTRCWRGGRLELLDGIGEGDVSKSLRERERSVRCSRATQKRKEDSPPRSPVREFRDPNDSPRGLATKWQRPGKRKLGDLRKRKRSVQRKMRGTGEI